MAKTNFSARFQGAGDPACKNSSGRKSNVVATFNQEHEDNIRILSRKLIEFVIEMKEDKIVPQAHGLILQDQRLKQFFELGEKVNANYAFLEYNKSKFDGIKTKVIECLVDSNIPIIQLKDGKDTSDIDYTRLLIDITSL